MSFVNPVTSHDVAGTVIVQVLDSGVDVTVYVVGAAPAVGGVIVTVALPSPATATGCAGTSGAVLAEGAEVPMAFVAVTL